MLYWVRLITDAIDVGLAAIILYLGSRVFSTIRLNLQQSSVRLFLGAAMLFGAHEVLSLFKSEQEVVLVIQELLQTGMILCLCLAMLQITRSQHSEINTLHRMADTDRLTGLDNLATFRGLAAAELGQGCAAGVTTALLMVDVDEFKRYNDEFGHEAGNVALQLVARTLRGTARGNDLVARYGGEEFALLLIIPSTAITSAAERMRAAIERECSPERNAALRRQLTVSIGVATPQSAEDSVDTLIHTADGELYRAKQAGRNRVCIAAGPAS